MGSDLFGCEVFGVEQRGEGFAGRELSVADIVEHEEDDVGCPLLGAGRRRSRRRRLVDRSTDHAWEGAALLVFGHHGGSSAWSIVVAFITPRGATRRSVVAHGVDRDGDGEHEDGIGAPVDPHAVGVAGHVAIAS